MALTRLSFFILCVFYLTVTMVTAAVAPPISPRFVMTCVATLMNLCNELKLSGTTSRFHLTFDYDYHIARLLSTLSG